MPARRRAQDGRTDGMCAPSASRINDRRPLFWRGKVRALVQEGQTCTCAIFSSARRPRNNSQIWSRALSHNLVSQKKITDDERRQGDTVNVSIPNRQCDLHVNHPHAHNDVTDETRDFEQTPTCGVRS